MATKEQIQEIPKSDQEKIIHFWKTKKNNSVPEIMKKFGYGSTTINKILNNYLKSIQECLPHPK